MTFIIINWLTKIIISFLKYVNYLYTIFIKNLDFCFRFKIANKLINNF